VNEKTNAALHELDENQLGEREAFLLMRLESISAPEERTTQEPQRLQLVSQESQPIIELSEEDVVETVYLENRVGMATGCTTDISTFFVLKNDLPEYTRLMKQYEEAVAEVVNADTLTIEAAMKADEARRNLRGFQSRILAADSEVAAARRLLEEAERKLLAAEQTASAIKADYAMAQTWVVEAVRKAEEANSNADSATFRTVILAKKASRYLLDMEISAAEAAHAKANRRAEGMKGVFSTVEEVDAVKDVFKVPFAFKPSALKAEEAA